MLKWSAFRGGSIWRDERLGYHWETFGRMCDPDMIKDKMAMSEKVRRSFQAVILGMRGLPDRKKRRNDAKKS
ncbi:MAG: hypothetical protein GXP32_09825 [Kiritimatiellaeota bacterium]|nr:hypothetical protein [Kiritimatiellota bacterium]